MDDKVYSKHFKTMLFSPICRALYLLSRKQCLFIFNHKKADINVFPAIWGFLKLVFNRS